MAAFLERATVWKNENVLAGQGPGQFTAWHKKYICLI